VSQEGNAQQAGGRARTCVTNWRALPSITGGSCAIILNDAQDRKAFEKARGAFDELRSNGFAALSESDDGAPFSIIDAEEVRALGAHPRAAFMLEAGDGYAFGSNYAGEVVTPSIQLGQHGYLPSRYFTTFIAAGANIKGGRDLGQVSITDIGPTIARALGLTLRDADGQPLPL
jgi:hypothetical protein